MTVIKVTTEVRCHCRTEVTVAEVTVAEVTVAEVTAASGIAT